MNKPERPTAGELLVAVLHGVFFLAYPIVVYFGRVRGAGTALLMASAVLLALRLRGAVELRGLVLQHAALPALIALAVALDSHTLMMLLPAVISLYLLATFSWSLRHGPPMIERFALLLEDDLPPFTRPYCRKVTWVWCAFFAVNATVVGALALAAPLRWWALYTGFILYLLLAALGAVEFLVRKWWFRYYGDGPIDRLLASIFPAAGTANGRRSLAYVERRRSLAADSAAQGMRQRYSG